MASTEDNKGEVGDVMSETPYAPPVKSRNIEFTPLTAYETAGASPKWPNTNPFKSMAQPVSK